MYSGMTVQREPGDCSINQKKKSKRGEDEGKGAISNSKLHKPFIFTSSNAHRVHILPLNLVGPYELTYVETQLP